MKKKRYDWERFLYQRGDTYSLGEDGFLTDPNSEYGSYFGQNLIPASKTQNIQCLILLGEPGIGKSHVLRELFDTFPESCESRPTVSKIYKDLRAYGSEQRLVDDLFKDLQFERWKKGNEFRVLCLDSLDEALIRIDTLASILLDEFGSLQRQVLDRLYLRIACRTGAWALWSEHLECGIRNLWPDEQNVARAASPESQFFERFDGLSAQSTSNIEFAGTRVYEIAPLRRVDVAIAATSMNICSDALLSEIDSRRVSAFARNPITLELLLNLAEAGGPLPVSRWELYNQGCLALCQENNRQRVPAQLRGVLTGNQRMEIAGLLAALTVFCNKNTIAIDTLPFSGKPEILDTSSTLGHDLGSGSPPLCLTKEHLEETLQNTSVFTSINSSLYGWCHKTYAEFLAAWHISRLPMDDRQVLSLVVATDNHTVPQLAETAAWLCSKSQLVRNNLIENDPDVALHSDPVSAPDLASLLVDSILGKLREGKIDRVPISHRTKYPILEHDRLDAQLTGYIVDGDEDWLVRRTAMDIAEACGATGIAESLCQVVMSSEESASLRAHAVLALGKLGTISHLNEISALLDSPIADDEVLELRGSLLHVLWPNSISTDKVISLLVVPSSRGIIGMYRYFLRHTFVDGISPDDVECLLSWLVSAPVGRRELREYGDIGRKTLGMAFRQLNNPNVVRLLATALHHLERHIDQIVGNEDEIELSAILAANDGQRRSLLRNYIACAAESNDVTFYFPHLSLPRIYLPADQNWLLEQLPHVPDGEKDTWNHFVHAMYDFDQPNALGALFECFKYAPSLKEKFQTAFQPVELTSDVAKRLREGLQMMKDRGKENTRPVCTLRAGIIDSRLKQLENGLLDVWWKLIQDLSRNDNGTYYECVMKSDLRELFGWQAASLETRERILNAAHQYVVSHQVDAQRQFGSTTFYRDDMGGYQALVLLMYEAPKFVETLPSEVWKNWCPAIIGFPISTTTTDIDASTSVLRRAYAVAPQVFLLSLDRTLREMLEAERHISIIHCLQEIIDGPISEVFLKLAREDVFTTNRRGELLRVGLSIQHPSSIKYAIELIRHGRGQVRFDDLRAEAAASVMLHVDGACWTDVWPVFQHDGTCALKLLHRYADLEHYAGKRYHLPDIPVEALFELYVWLVTWFPYQLDPDRTDSHFVTSHDRILDLRRGLLSRLVSLGTPHSVSLLHRIQRRFPRLDWMKWQVSEAEQMARQRSWRPLEPEQFVRLLSNRKHRLIESEEQLLHLVVESLQRYQEEMRGETFLWFRLWDKQPDGKTYRPKEEERLSDDIAVFLRRDLQSSQVVVNREVQIHSRSQHSSDKTDIRVDAFRRDSKGQPIDSIAVIIEVKGCWNPELLTGMEHQLIRKYLHENSCRSGVYVTGWYVCELWDDYDPKKTRAKRHGNEESLRYLLEEQAVGFSQFGSTIKSFVVDCSIPVAP